MFFPTYVSYAKFILMVVGGECRSLIFILSFYVGSAAHPNLDIENVIKCLNIWFIL